jgi:hypothetical protein
MILLLAAPSWMPNQEGLGIRSLRCLAHQKSSIARCSFGTKSYNTGSRPEISKHRSEIGWPDMMNYLTARDLQYDMRLVQRQGNAADHPLW